MDGIGGGEAAGAQGRPLTTAERCLVYGVVGVAAEVGFTAVGDALAGRGETRRLMGHTYLWMPPIWALGGLLCQRLGGLLRGRELGVPVRAAAYAATCLAVEGATGAALRRLTGRCPWDYGISRFSVRGLVRLDYAPFWAVAGLASERMCALLSRVRLQPRARPQVRLRELFRFGCQAVDPALLAEGRVAPEAPGAAVLGALAPAGPGAEAIPAPS